MKRPQDPIQIGQREEKMYVPEATEVTNALPIFYRSHFFSFSEFTNWIFFQLNFVFAPASSLVVKLYDCQS